jgi:hypothetical protein
MLRNSLIFLISFCLAITIFVWAENQFAPSFQACIGQNASEQGGENAKNIGNGIASIAKSQAICSLRLIDRHNGFFAALAALVVAAFTFTLWIATSKQAGLTFESLKLAREEFAAINRPEIGIHSIEVRHIPSEKGDCLGASILCFNRGRTAAKKIEVRGDILITHKLEIDVQRKTVQTFPTVSSGQKMRIEVTSERLIRDLNTFVRLRRDVIATGRLPFAYCVGTIEYLDQNETRRETAFCYILTNDHLGEHWDSAASPEHQYAY